MDRVTRDQVEEASKKKFGNDTTLIDYEVKEFLSKGDSNTTTLFRVLIKVEVNDETHDGSMIVKVHPDLKMPETDSFYLKTFKKEGGFYNQIAPLLNTELTLIGHVELRMPKCYHLHLENNVETIYIEDLEEAGFPPRVTFPRTDFFDVSKTVLVLQELARLHGASMLFARRSSNVSILEKFPFLTDICGDEELIPQLVDLFSGFLKGASDCAQETGYNNVAEKILDISENFGKIIGESIKTTSSFEGIIHLDCYQNNYMFEYSKSGSPTSVALFDFQLATVGSVICDLSAILHTCCRGEERRKNLECYLYTYYATLSSVFLSAGSQVPFTMEEMKDEYNRLEEFGLLCGTFNSAVLTEAEDMSDFNPGDETLMEYQRKQVIKSFEVRPDFKSFFIDIFDEFNKLI